MADDDIKPEAEGRETDAQDTSDALNTDSSDFVADGADAEDQAATAIRGPQTLMAQTPLERRSARRYQ